MLNSNKGCDWSCKKCREYGTDIKDLKALILNLQDDIRILKEENAEFKKGSEPPNVNFEEIVAEVSERSKRKKNLIIFSVPEQNQNLSAEARLKGDSLFVSSLLNHLTEDHAVSNVKPMRLGHYQEGRVRPLKITLNSEDSVSLFIRHAAKLKDLAKYRNVRISYDRTPRQLEHYRRLRQSVAEAKDRGENLQIKYIRGIPTLVPLNK